MPDIEIRFTDSAGKQIIEHVPIDESAHLASLGPAILEMQSRMNKVLTAEMQSTAKDNGVVTKKNANDAQEEG